MMKVSCTLAVFAVIAVFASANNHEFRCELGPVPIPSEWKTMHEQCTSNVKEQVRRELSAAITYMAMGAHFSQDTINKPGFAKLFFEAAKEEREHAIKLIDYLQMRGNTDLNTVVTDVPKPLKVTWKRGYDALVDALQLETSVTKHINNLIKTCEAPNNRPDLNDYHIVDYLTSDFLEEQYRGQRDIGGKVSTLGKMIQNHGGIGEFMFDKKLLHGEL